MSLRQSISISDMLWTQNQKVLYEFEWCQKFNKMLGQNTNYLVQTLQPSTAHCTFRDVKY